LHEREPGDQGRRLTPGGLRASHGRRWWPRGDLRRHEGRPEWSRHFLRQSGSERERHRRKRFHSAECRRRRWRRVWRRDLRIGGGRQRAERDGHGGVFLRRGRVTWSERLTWATVCPRTSYTT